MQNTLSNKLVSSLKPKEKPFEVRDNQLKGLLLRVQPSGIMTFYLEFARGKRVKVGRAGTLTANEAREIARKLLVEVYQGQDPTKKRQPTDLTYGQFVSDVYKTWLLNNLKDGKAALRRLEVSFSDLKGTPLSEITPWVIEKWRSKRQQEGLKPASINRDIADLKACLNRAVEWEYLAKHPLEKFKLCKLDPSANVRYLSLDEEKRLRNALDVREETIRTERERYNQWRKVRHLSSYRDLRALTYADYLKPAVLVSLNTGLRRGELFGLKWESINFEKRFLTVLASTAKTGRTRHINLNDEALYVMSEWKAQNPGTTYVFENPDGKPFHDVRKSWAKVLLEAQVKGFRWHDLRHTFASNLVMAGVDLNTVRELLGHTDYKMTLRYAHLAPEHKMKAVQQLNKRLTHLLPEDGALTGSTHG